MIKNKSIILWAVVVIAALVIAAALFLSSVSRSSFKLINHTDMNITEIYVIWRDKSMKAGGIIAGGTKKIHINDEAAAKFKVIFQDSKTIESKEIYFSGPEKILVDIYKDKIDLNYR